MWRRDDGAGGGGSPRDCREVRSPPVAQNFFRTPHGQLETTHPACASHPPPHPHGHATAGEDSEMVNSRASLTESGEEQSQSCGTIASGERERDTLGPMRNKTNKRIQNLQQMEAYIYFEEKKKKQKPRRPAWEFVARGERLNAFCAVIIESLRWASLGPPQRRRAEASRAPWRRAR